jgi:predicted  nucleic acid-binding Zn-ribbon protein
MSDTPRTDSEGFKVTRVDSYGREVHEPYVDTEFARQLERELTTMTEERDELLEEVKSLKESIRDQEHHIMELERLRRYSPGPHMGQD